MQEFNEIFYETINYRIPKPQKEVGMDVVIADCTTQCGYWGELPDSEF